MVAKPKTRQMSNEEIFTELSQVDKQIKTLLKCKPLPETEVRNLCQVVSKPSKHIGNCQTRLFSQTNGAIVKSNWFGWQCLVLTSLIGDDWYRPRTSSLRNATYMRSVPQWPFAEIFTDSSTISVNFSRSEDSFPKPTISSWEIMLIEATTQ